MSHASERPPYITFINDRHYPMKFIGMPESQSWAMRFIVNSNDINFQLSTNNLERFFPSQKT